MREKQWLKKDAGMESRLKGEPRSDRDYIRKEDVCESAAGNMPNIVSYLHICTQE